MNERVIDFSSIVDFCDFYGSRVRVAAVLVIRGRECFLVRDLSNPLPDDRIEVFHPGLEEKLDASVGGWMGGPATYFDLVEMVGVIRPGTTRRDMASISDISRICLERDGVFFEIEI